MPLTGTHSIFDAAVPLGEESHVYWRSSQAGTLTGSELEFYPPATQPAIDPSIIDGDGPSYVYLLWFRSWQDRVFLNLSASASSHTDPADEFTSDAESDVRIALQYKTHRLAIAITSDFTEPYDFTPSNAAAVSAFRAAWIADADRATEPVHVALVWGGDDSRVDLSDFTTQLGFSLDALPAGTGELLRAVITVGSLEDDDLYRASVTGSADGDLDVGTDHVIDRIRWRTDGNFILNESAAASLSDVFGAGASGKSVFVWTGDGVFAEAEPATFDRAGGGYARWRLSGEPWASIRSGLVTDDTLLLVIADQGSIRTGTVALSAAFAGGPLAGQARLRLAMPPRGDVVRAPGANPVSWTFGVRAVGGMAARPEAVTWQIQPLAAGATVSAFTPAVPARPGAPAPGDAGARWLRAARALAPARVLVAAIEVDHPEAAAPVRVVRDTRDWTIEEQAYSACAFGVRLAADAEGQPPRAEVWIDNVGAVLTQWVEQTRGAEGASIRLMQFSCDPADLQSGGEIEWEHTLQVQSMAVGGRRVTARLGVPSLRGRAAVVARHDPTRSPGLF